VSAAVQVSITISGSACTPGPPNYYCSQAPTTNPGLITAPFATTLASGTVSTYSTTTGGCTPVGGQTCVQLTGGTNFNTSWPLTKALVVNGGGPYTVVAWNSTTVATVAATPALAAGLTGVSYTFYGAPLTGGQNSTGYDTTLNPSGTDCITQMTDQATNVGQSSNGTVDGSANDFSGSINEDFLAFYGNGGGTRILYVNTTGNCDAVVNTGDISGSKGIGVTGEFSFSRTLDTRFYYTQSRSQIWQADIPAGTANSVNSGGNSIVTFVTNNSAAPPLSSWTGTLAVNYVNYPISSCTSSTCTIVGNTGTLTNKPYAKTDIAIETELVDLLGAGVCPGVVPFTPASNSIMTVSQTDQRFAITIAPGGQGTADWAFVWDKTLGCSTANFNTGQIWGFLAPGTCSTSACSEAIPPIGTLQGTVNTTLTQAVTSTGSQTTCVLASTNLRVGDSFIIDPGLATQEQVQAAVPTGGPCGFGGWRLTANFTQLHSSGAVVTGTSCWGSNGAGGHGIHDGQMSLDGNYTLWSINGPPWSQGQCAGSTISNQLTVWHNGTIGDSWFYNGSNAGGGPFFNNHPSTGVTHAISYVFSGMNIRPIASPQSYTLFAPGGIVQDAHYGQPHPLGDDSYPAVGATDSMLAAQFSGCSTPAHYPPECPLNQVNVIQALFPNALNQLPTMFTHTYGCGPPGSIYARCKSGAPDSYFGSQYSIGLPTAKGGRYCFASSMLQGLGLDSNGNYHADFFCVRLQ
jgi:hypothetical protein